MSYTFHQTGQQIQDLMDYFVIHDTVTVSSLPLTRTKEGMTAKHKMVYARLGTPSAQTADWTVTPAAGQYTISGSISGSTTVDLVFIYVP